MTHLICQVQRLYLGDDKRTLIKEKEIFEVDEQTAEQYVKGGIAKPVPELVTQPEPETTREEISDETVQAEGTEKVTQQQQKKRR